VKNLLKTIPYYRGGSLSSPPTWLFGSCPFYRENKEGVVGGSNMDIKKKGIGKGISVVQNLQQDLRWIGKNTIYCQYVQKCGRLLRFFVRILVKLTQAQCKLIDVSMPKENFPMEVV
jgi:hypothetical protein